MFRLSDRRLIKLLTFVGLAFYALGICLAKHPGVGLGIRLVGLGMMGFAVIQRRSLTAWTLFFIVAGAEVGADAPSFAVHLKVLADIFLRLIRVIVAPLILGSLVTGIAGHGRLKTLGRIAWKTLLYFEIVTTLALLFGAAAIHLTRAGESVAIPATAAINAAPVPSGTTFDSFLLNLFPENIALAVAQNQVLQVVVFSILFGIALAMLSDEKKAPLLSLLKSLTETMFQFTRIIMYFAPVAAGAAMAYTLASMGLQSLLPLGKLLLTFYGAAIAFVLLVLLPIALLAKIPLRRFLRAAAEPTVLGFATSTSEAALPLAMENMEEFGVPRPIVSFVIPTGYSFNMDGASLYLSIATLFAVQAAGMHLSLSAQLTMLATLMLTSKGLAGVPRAILAILLATAGTFHLPVAALMMILGIDALMDMGRTALNVLGNCLAAAVISRFESSNRRSS